MDDTTKLLGEVFFQTAKAETERIVTSDSYLVHYTSAAAALSILDEERPSLWMRSARCMNDRQEVDGGIDRIAAVLGQEDLASRLRNGLNACHDTLASDVAKLLDDTMSTLAHATWIACLSEHSPKEDLRGRLSMWRGYGGTDTGVAIVLNKEFLTSSSMGGLFVFNSPAFYGSDDELRGRFVAMLDALDSHRDRLRNVERERIAHAVGMMLTFAAVSMKHPGFEEEKEWRLLYLPTIFSSAALQDAIVTISGVPQKIFRIPLADQPDHGISGVTPRDLIRRIIIGPTQFGSTIAAAFAARLQAHGVPEPWAKLQLSDIPLRV